MIIEQKMLEIWSADAGAVALVPAARFKPPGNWQSLARPYVIQYPVASQPIQTHDNKGARVAMNIWSFYQLSVYADSFLTGRTVAQKVESVFNGNIQGVQFLSLGQRWNDRDDQSGIEHFVVEFRISESL